jgi:uncharacterized protein (TIGR02996 family)
LASLFADILRAPADDSLRLVYADQLMELHDPFGDFISLSLQSGVHRRRLEQLRRAHEAAWLGPLGQYLEEVEYERGLPSAAKVVRRPPAALLSEVVADARLGTFVRLRRASNCPPKIYAALIASPQAVALRRIDASDASIVKAARLSGRTTWTHLYDAALENIPIHEELAHPAFDQVTYVELGVAWNRLGPPLQAVALDRAGFFRRRPRELHIAYRYGEGPELVFEAWPQLPVARLSMENLLLLREKKGTVLVFSGALFSFHIPLFALVPGLRMVRFEQHQEHALLDRLRARLPEVSLELPDDATGGTQ